MKSINSGLFDFETLITGNYTYVDKTEHLWNLMNNKGVSYFLSRPRRFGKSLTISTLKCIFEGKKELFEGLAISKKDYDWKKYPIINLSLADVQKKASNAIELGKYLASLVDDIALENRITLDKDTAGLRLKQLIDRLYEQGGSVVIFVDEYDKPILNNIDSPEIKGILAELKGFYSVLKAQNAKIRFLFVTGVTKFSHVSIFSDLNNLKDITMSRDYASMLGYTQEELERFFAEHIEKAIVETELDRKQLLSKIKSWYDGYKFNPKGQNVYNPVSIANFFTEFEFNNYWFDTGTPSFLIKLAKEKNFDVANALKNPVPEITFSGFEIDNIDPITLMFQTGYITIKSCDQTLGFARYMLDFPNNEVRESFQTYLLGAYAGITPVVAGRFYGELLASLYQGDIDTFMESMKTFFAGINYDFASNVEGRYHLIFHTILYMLGANIESEVRTNNGRIDCVIETKEQIYIFEFKINQPATKALEQIKEKAYYQKYANLGKTIILVGASFSTDSRQLTEYTSQTC